MKDVNILTWVFFASQGITDNCDLMRAQMYIIECRKDGATVQSVKESTGYKSCLYDLHDSFLTDEYIQKIIDFELEIQK